MNEVQPTCIDVLWVVLEEILKKIGLGNSMRCASSPMCRTSVFLHRKFEPNASCQLCVRATCPMHINFSRRLLEAFPVSQLGME